jgi:predicted enzyme related to lactoylglutathione lyase
MKVPELNPRETVILAEDFDVLVAWYRDVLGFEVAQLFEDGMHYANLNTASGIRIGIGLAAEVQVEPRDRGANTVVLQFEVDDVAALLSHVGSHGGMVQHGPTFNQEEGFWFGAFADPEGNPIWVVDAACP